MKGKIFIGMTGIAIALIMLTGSVRGVNMWPSLIDERIEQAQEEVKGVYLCEFQQAVEKGDYDMIIDVREGEEYAAGHVPGAVNIPRGMLEFDIWKHVGYPGTADLGKKIYLYCQDGRRAILCAQALQELGFTNVAALAMEFDEWPGAGGRIASIEGSVQFESDPVHYNLDF